MEYGKLFSRSVNIVWQNKFLIVLGILAALGGGSFNGGARGGGGGGGGNGPLFGGSGQVPQVDGQIAGLAVGIVIALVCVALFVAIIFWVISTIARGGLIAGVDTIESGGKSSFSQAWSAGWKKVWTLLAIGFIPAIPGLILVVVGLLGLVAYGGASALFGGELAGSLGSAEIGIIGVILLCIIAPIALVLSILRTFAERACMLENLGAIEAYRRGTKVLMANLGEAILLFVLQIIIFVGLGILLFVPGLIIALCCFLWPLLLVVQGGVSAVISALWTMAWRTWTGKPTIVEKEPVMA
ncbi:MAG: hypothetical protein WAM60_18540 [Candidatus Promineifilaceae bacterium]